MSYNNRIKSRVIEVKDRKLNLTQFPEDLLLNAIFESLLQTFPLKPWTYSLLALTLENSSSK
jgi:hypothetical protein